MRAKTKAAFVEPMLLLPADALPESPGWTYKLKLDGYRAIAIKTNGKVQLRSRNNKDFNTKYPDIAHTLASLPDETIVDGEIVALDENGRPSFNSLQNYGAAKASLFFYVFDVLVPDRDWLVLYLVRQVFGDLVSEGQTKFTLSRACEDLLKIFNRGFEHGLAFVDVEIEWGAFVLVQR